VIDRAVARKVSVKLGPVSSQSTKVPGKANVLGQVEG
jgi:hypothetical protein